MKFFCCFAFLRKFENEIFAEKIKYLNNDLRNPLILETDEILKNKKIEKIDLSNYFKKENKY